MVAKYYAHHMTYAEWLMSGKSPYVKPHNLDEIYIVNVSEGHWWTERVPDFIEKFNKDQLGLDPRIHSTNQIFLCWYKEQAREIVKAINEDG